eukprot:2913274-Pyramimonas_sp.AAC.1
MRAIEWQFASLAQGRRPTERYDGQPFGVGEAPGGGAGAPLTHRAFLLCMKGDWAEHASVLGLSSWSSKFAPCQFCRCCKHELHEFNSQLGVEGGPAWLLKDHNSYHTDCRRCE